MSIFHKAAKLKRLTLHDCSNDFPKILILFVTSNCNQRCNHCFYSENLNNSNDLCLEEIEKISKNLGHIDNLLLSGGEPFIRKDLPDIVASFYRQNGTRSFNIPTNGTLGDRIIAFLEILKVKCPDAKININFSFDGLADTHNKIRNFKNAFNKSMANLELLLERFGQDSMLNFFVASTIMNTNAEEMIKLSKFVEKKFQKKVPILYGFLRGNPKDPTLYLPNIKQLRKIHAAALEERKNATLVDKIIYNAAFESKISILKSKKQVFQCRGGELMGVIYANGDVSSCEILPPVGNIREADSFKDLWHSDKATKQRELIKKRKCYCTHECFITPSLLYNRMNWALLPYYFIKNAVENMFANKS